MNRLWMVVGLACCPAWAQTTPTLAVSVPALYFEYRIGGSLPGRQLLRITASAGSLSWTAAISAASGQAWLSLSATSGVTPSSVYVSAAPAGLAAGQYTRSVIITAAGAANSPVSVPVTLNVTGSSTSTQDVTPASLTFQAQVGQPPPAQLLTLSSSTPKTFTAAASVTWLAVTPGSGTAPATVSVSVSPGSLSPGQYTASVTVTFAGATPIAVPVTLSVVGSGSVTQGVAPAALAFEARPGQSVPSQTLSIAPVSPQSFSVAASAAWVSLNPARGTTPAVVTVTVNPVGFSPGLYSAAIQVLIGSSSVTVPVTLVVAGTTTLLAAHPAALSFERQLGQANPPSQSLAISSTGAALNWSVASSAAWLQASPVSGTGTGAVSVTVSPGSLGPGRYNATLTISASGAANSPLTVPVALVLVASSDVQAAQINAVVSAATSTPIISAGSWFSIYGTNLSQQTRAWRESDFAGGRLPLELEGIRVTVNGRRAAVQYVSPTQINALAPADATFGAVRVEVSSAATSGTVVLSQYAPGFFLIASEGRSYAAAVHTDGTLVGWPGLVPGVVSRPATPGEVILIFGAGFGPTNPAVDPGALFSGAAPLVAPVEIRFSGVPARVWFAGLSAPGLDQFNVMVPNLPPGDHVLTAQVGGVTTASGVLISVQ